MAASYDLCTVADVQSYLGSAVAADAVIIQTLITAASVLIQTYLGYSPALQAYTETFNGLANDRRMLTIRPAASVTAVSIDGVAIPPRATPSGSGYTSDKNMVYLSGYTFTRNFQNVVISYTAGFASIPEDIKQVCIELAANKHKRRTRIGVSSTGMGREMVTFNKGDLSTESMLSIDQYQLVAMA